MLQIPGVSLPDALTQRNLRPPPERVNAAHVEQLPRSSVRLARIKHQPASVTKDVANQFGQFADGHILAHADVHDLRRIVLLQQEPAGLGEIMDVKKFPSWGARAP